MKTNALCLLAFIALCLTVTAGPTDWTDGESRGEVGTVISATVTTTGSYKMVLQTALLDLVHVYIPAEVIDEAGIASKKEANALWKSYRGHKAMVQGTVKHYRGKPELVVAAFTDVTCIRVGGAR
jgi:hypothetical protein